MTKIRPDWTMAIALMLAAATIHSPARAQISVLGSLASDRDVSPGETYSGQITVRNDTKDAAQAKIYQTDYLFYHDGTNYFEEPGTTPRSNAAWVQFNPAVITLEPGESGIVNYVVAVPSSVGDTLLAGSYWSMLMIEGIAKDSPESTLGDTDRPQFGIRQVTRYGVQIASHIRANSETNIDIAGVELRQEALGVPTLQLNIENSGNVLIVPETWVELYDASGTLARRISGQQSRVYPGTSVSQRFKLADTPEGAYDALVVVDGGNDNLFGAQYR
ncbi:MAG: hypothetical protein HKN13_04015, partial [Rhodothermales bacterium]|nr:hypothetical protein [Rhodothermales bacterium]